MVKSGDTGDFEHRWVPDKSGSMWIEFVIVGSGITAQTSTFYADNGQSDGFFEGIAELNPVLLIVISILAISLIGLLIFGLRTPNNPNLRQMPQNKNYRRATRQMPQQPQQQQQYYANQQSILSPGDDPYR